jgi:TolA-binding protein
MGEYPEFREVLSGVALKRTEQNIWIALHEDADLKQSLTELVDVLEPEPEMTYIEQEDTAPHHATSFPEDEQTPEPAKMEAIFDDGLDSEPEPQIQPLGPTPSVPTSRGDASGESLTQARRHQTEKVESPLSRIRFPLGLALGVVVGVTVGMFVGADRSDSPQEHAPPTMIPEVDRIGIEAQEKARAKRAQREKQALEANQGGHVDEVPVVDGTAPKALGDDSVAAGQHISLPEDPPIPTKRVPRNKKVLRKKMVSAYEAQTWGMAVACGEKLKTMGIDWEAEFTLAQAKRKGGWLRGAVTDYRAFAEKYQENVFADDALFWAAEILREHDPALAKELYKRILSMPKADKVKAARKRLKQ